MNVWRNVNVKGKQWWKNFENKGNSTEEKTVNGFNLSSLH